MKRNLYLPISILWMALILINCTSSNSPSTIASVIKLSSSSTLGNYMTDKNGLSLYVFANDANGENNCTDGCTANWSVFYVSGLYQAELGNGLLLSDFDTITTTSGKQLTYKGWPLYQYAPGGVHEQAGQTNGDGIGGLWFVAKPTYTVMLANYQLVGLDGNNYVASATDVTSLGTGLTKYFTDFAGRTLYSFSKDSALVNKFTKSDFSNNSVWPIYISSKLDLPSALDKTLFDSIPVYGYEQLTYKGWPMFYYGADLENTGKFRGNTKGVSVPTPNIWTVFSSGIPPAPSK